MRAVTYPAYSTDLSTLRVEELPRPKLAPSAVLIEVRAASVNPVDWKVMTGGLDGLMEYSEPKAVWVETDAEAPLAFGY